MNFSKKKNVLENLTSGYHGNAFVRVSKKEESRCIADQRRCLVKKKQQCGQSAPQDGMFCFFVVVFLCFFFIQAWFSYLELVFHSRPVMDHWGTFCAGGHPKVHFRWCR